MKLLKTTLLLFWLLINFHLAAQVRPYEDYGQCLIGFRTSDEKVVLEPQFDSWERIWVSNSAVGYIVRQGEQYGYVSDSGAFVIHCTYKRLESIPEWGFIVKSNNHKSGILDLKGNEIVQSDYDYIQPIKIHINGSWQEDSIFGFFGKRNDQLDFIDQQGVKKIGDFVESWLIYNWHSQTPWNEEMFCIVQDSLNKFGLIELDGSQILPTEYDEIKSYFIHNRFLLKENDKVRVFNSQTNTLSPEFDNIELFGDLTIVWKGKQWCVVDSNFNITSDFFQGIPSHTNPLPAGEKYWVYYQEGMETGVAMNPNREILFLTKPIQSKKYSEYGYSPFKWGLINYKTGAKIPKKYDNISQFVGMETDYYWCFKRLDTKSNGYDYNRLVDIYNDQLKLTQRYILVNEPIGRQVSIGFSKIYDSTAFLVQELKTNNFGWLKYSGEPITPFIFKKNKQVTLQKYDSNRSTIYAHYHSLAKDSLFALFDNDANQLSDFNYTGFSGYENKMLLARNKDGTNELFDFNGKKLIDNVSQIGTFGVYQSQARHAHSDIKAPYVVHKGVLKLMDSDSTFSVVDDQRVYFEEPTILLHGSFLIRRDGSVILSVPYRISKSSSIYQCQLRDNLVIFNYLGGELLNIHDVATYTSKGKILTVVYRNGEKALWNISKRKWLVPRESLNQIVPIQSVQGRYKEEFFWFGEKDSSGILRWSIMNSDGDEMIDFTTDRSNSTPIVPFQIVSEGAFHGLIDTDFKLVLPIENDCIFQFDKQTVAYLKNGKWGLYAQSGKKTEAIYENISGYSNNSKYYVFSGDSISVLDRDFKVIVPPTSINNLKTKNQLAKLLHISTETGQTNALMGLFPFHQKDAEYEALFNERLIYYLKVYTIGTIHKSQGKSNLLWVADHRYPYINGAYKIHYSKNGYLSQQRENHVAKTVNRENFRFYGNEWHSIEITDIIVPGKEEELDVMIVDEITRRQTFGFKCINTPQLIRTLKSNWILTEQGIVFSGFEDDREQLMLRYETLNSILIQPL